MRYPRAARSALASVCLEMFDPSIRSARTSESVNMVFDFGTLVMVAVLPVPRTSTREPLHPLGKGTESFFTFVITALVMRKYYHVRYARQEKTF